MDDLLAAGYRVLRFDNRGVGGSAKPAGPYTTELFADGRQGAGRPARHHRLPPDGRLDGRDDRPAVRPGLPRRPAVGHVRLHVRGARPVLLADVRMWADMAPVLGVPFVMRDVTLWAFTISFFEERAEELAEFETAMRYMDQPVHAYLAQLAVIQNHDTTARLGRDQRAHPRAGRRGGHPHPGLAVPAAARGGPRLGVGHDAGRPRLPLGAPGRRSTGVPDVRRAHGKG